MAKLKVICFNPWGLFWPFSPINARRFSRTVKYLKKGDYDVICLQECWLPRHLKEIKKEFPNYYITTANKGHYSLSGLITLTKIKPKSVKFFKFKRNLTTFIYEAISSKGILLTEIKIGKKNVFVVNTHTFARVHDGHTPLLYEQLGKIKKCLEKIPNLIFCSDLNIVKEEFLKWNNKLLQSPFPKNPELDPKNPYRKDVFIHYLDESNFSSYVGVKTNPSKVKIKTSVDSKVYLSDHQPIISEISF